MHRRKKKMLNVIKTRTAMPALHHRVGLSKQGANTSGKFQVLTAAGYEG
jgi:hypothetical protein